MQFYVFISSQTLTYKNPKMSVTRLMFLVQRSFIVKRDGKVINYT